MFHKFDPKKVGSFELKWWRAHNENDKEKMLKFLKLQYQNLFNLDSRTSELVLKYLLSAIESHNGQDFQTAQKEMTKFYEVITDKTGLNFDTKLAATYEVDWWELHDRLEHSADKSEITNLFQLLYSTMFSLDPKNLKCAAEYRTLATYEHDLAGDPLTDKSKVEFHWKRCAIFLERFYEELFKNVQ